MKYKDFSYQVSELSAFAVTCGIFTISLKDGKVVHYSPSTMKEEEEFYDWLMKANIREVIPAVKA